MKNETEEKYVFLRTCTSDFHMAEKSLLLMADFESGYIQFVLLRDAVISYGRPFSENRGKHISPHRLSIEFVPDEYSQLHSDILRLRNTLFAHSDILAKNPKLALLGATDPIFAISHKGNYFSEMKENLDSMNLLIACVQEKVRQHQLALEEILRNKTHQVQIVN